MKRYPFFLPIIFIWFVSISANCQEVWFQFDGSYSGETRDQQILSKGFKEIFQVDIVQAIHKEFPCAKVSFLGDIKYCIAEMQLWGLNAFGAQNVEPKIKNLMNRINNSDYWVFFCFYPLNDEMANATLKCYDKNRKVLVNYSINVPIANLLGKKISQAAEKFINELTKYEICPYIGPISIDVKSELHIKTTDKYPVYCNGSDKEYHKDIEITKTSNAQWRLHKTDKYLTSGNLSFTLREEEFTDETNNCYLCPSGRKGSRVYTEKIIKTASISGLSSESVSNGQNISDARTEITFLENGTYTVQVKAASKKGEMKIKTERHAEGTCDLINKTPETITKNADVPLKIALGPFPGSGKDKTLSQKGSFEMVDPVTKEKTTYTFDFNLTRK